MAIGMLGRKVGMTQIYQASGEAVPVTVIEAGPCHVLQIRTAERDGYEAVQLGFLDKPRPKHPGGKKPRHAASRSERGHVAKLDSKRAKRRAAAGIELPPKPNCEPKRFIREFRVKPEGVAVGDQVSAAMFEPSLEQLPRLLKELAEQFKLDTEKAGWQKELEVKKPAEYAKVLNSIQAVDVIGTSKGRGFAGVMKRHNFKGQRATHGVKKCHRHMGSTGCRTFPGRIFKGKRMPGHFGHERCTSRNLKVVRVDAENSLLLVRGAVPGPNGGYVMIQQTNSV